ncbi:RBBP9/YdeN family alpha/beta hydrolase [Mammaliicoccus stepanovicii]|uniref:Esterase n=1 Tax=Mammaliicoccus stepanovicii TaxID=643214 RepID=A0A239YE82_9STAP|nr:alpha/beta hydrolase [Mammaliicoccus stepanovicii]PNZ75539.1 serine hydrolase family protein [Mammaliicoccus stepanovicii]GGI42623.1 putative hydrolase YdeN [Mammaliicoccus stepanovicii]SNV56703.1 esterase [Mammaliicoccus stepanovicii]
MSEQNLYIAHGYNASSDRHWFKWLTEQLKEVHSYIFDFPDPTEPVLENWLTTLNQEMDLSSGENIIVAHSLGVITVLDYLSKYEGELNVKGLVLVAGFDEKIPNLKKLDPYIDKTNQNYDKIIQQIPYIVSIAGDNDRTVPYELSVKMSKNLNVEVVTLKHDGHFCDRDGYDTFPEVRDYVENIFNNEAGI